MTMTTTTNLSTTIVNGTHAFDQVRTAWTDLFERAHASQSLSWHAQRSWWSRVNRGAATPHIVVVHRDATPIAIAPFFAHEFRLFGVNMMRTMSLIGDQGDIVVDRELDDDARAEALALIVDELLDVADDYDVLALDDSGTARALTSDLASRGATIDRAIDHVVCYGRRSFAPRQRRVIVGYALRALRIMRRSRSMVTDRSG